MDIHMLLFLFNAFTNYIYNTLSCFILWWDKSVRYCETFNLGAKHGNITVRGERDWGGGRKMPSVKRLLASSQSALWTCTDTKIDGTIKS